MSSKRVAAREWKRKRKHQQRMTRLTIAAVCVLAILGIGYIGWDMWSRTYVMTFEGQRIGTAYMRYFSAFSNWMGDPHEQALDNLTQFLLIEQAARRNNIVLTEEELEEAAEHREVVQEHLDMMGISVSGISDARLRELSYWNVFTERLIDIYSADLVIDEDDFEESFQEFLTWNRTDFLEMNFKFHRSSDMDTSFAVWGEFADLETDDEFDEIILRDLQLETGLNINDLEVPTISLDEMRHDPDFAQAIWHLTDLNVGEFSQPIPIGEDSFYIFIVESMEMTPEEEISEIYREEYIREQQVQIIVDLLEEWREAADIRINQRGVNAAL